MSGINKTKDITPRWDRELFRPIVVPANIDRPLSAIEFDRAQNNPKLRRGVFVFVDMAAHNAKRKQRLSDDKQNLL